ncbi:MAG: hypothetical protein GY768_26530 [Planctomycetaceae bacterium]|nr:hypothetical protein [Planctomycetaceae bacterium]
MTQRGLEMDADQLPSRVVLFYRVMAVSVAVVVILTLSFMISREPWERVLVDFDGTVYPCLGGEVWFRNKVQSGAINFGNLINEYILNVVNSEGYIRARRSYNAFSGENVLKECQDCHPTLDRVGPDVKHAHMLKMPQITNRVSQE